MHRVNKLPLILMFLSILIGCSAVGNSLNPDWDINTNTDMPPAKIPSPKVHGITACVDFGQVVIDKKNGTGEIIHPRGLGLALNALWVMEPPPYKYLSIDWETLKIDFEHKMIEVDVIIIHPLNWPFYRGFDVRGVVFGPDVLNADGYTTFLNPDDFTGIPYGYIDGLFGTPDEIAQFDTPWDLWGYKYFCNGLDKNDNLSEFFSDPANIAMRGTFSPGSQNQRHYKLYFGEDPGEFLVFNYAVLVSFHGPKGEKPWDIDNFEITTCNAAEPFQCSVGVLDNSLYFWDDEFSGGSVKLDLCIGDWQGFDDYDVKIQFADAFGTMATPTSHEMGPLPHFEVFHFPEIALKPTSSGEMPFLVNATDLTTTFGECWFQGLLPGSHPMYNDPVYTCWKPTIHVMPHPPFNIVDITPPYFEPLHPSDVWVHDGFAYITSTEYRMTVLDVSDPVNPVWIMRCEDPRTIANAIWVDGDYAYFAMTGASLVVADITDPVNTSVVGSCTAYCVTQDVTVQDDYAYLAGYIMGKNAILSIVDVSDPAAPEHVGLYEFDEDGSSPVNRLCVNGNYAYFSGNNFYVVDISNPAVPKPVGEYYKGNNTGLAYANGYVYGVTRSTFEWFEVFDVSDPTNPFVISYIDNDPTVQSCSSDLKVIGDYAYVTRDPMSNSIISKGGLYTVNISDPYNPYVVNLSPVPDNCEALFVDADNIFTTSRPAGLYCFDRSSPTEPSLIGTYLTPGLVDDAIFLQDYIIAANYTSGLLSVDISSPASPQMAGFYDTPGRAECLDLNLNIVCAGGYDESFQVFDYTDPSSPELLGTDDSFYGFREVTVMGSYAFASRQNSSWWAVFDVNDPYNPFLIGEFDEGIDCGKIFAEDGIAYIPTYDNILIYDVSTPSTPLLLSEYETKWSPKEVIVEDGIAYIACKDGLDIADVADPENPEYIGSFPISLNKLRAMEIAYECAFVGGQSLLAIINVSNPENPSLEVNIPPPSIMVIEKILTRGDLAYLMGDSFRVIKLW